MAEELVQGEGHRRRSGVILRGPSAAHSSLLEQSKARPTRLQMQSPSFHLVDQTKLQQWLLLSSFLVYEPYWDSQTRNNPLPQFQHPFCLQIIVLNGLTWYPLAMYETMEQYLCNRTLWLSRSINIIIAPNLTLLYF